jgi:RNA polymerase II subunit A C-terminal domain phosphatase
VASDTPTIDSLVAIAQADDPEIIAAQTDEQNALLEAQQAKRPLAAAQHALDIKSEAQSESESDEDEELYGDKASHKSTPPASPQKQSLLRDDDSELVRLQGVLKNVWERFYEAYRKSLEGLQREKQLVRLEGRGRSATTETGKVPDIRDIMSEMRMKVLAGVKLVFSGVIPLNIPWQKYRSHAFGCLIGSHDYTQLARQFGATVVNEMSSSVTHVVAVRVQVHLWKLTNVFIEKHCKSKRSDSSIPKM